MIVAPHTHRPGREAEDLTGFLAFCRERTRRTGEPALASVTLPVRHIDPLAVLLATRRVEEPWYYRECPSEDVAVAAVGAASARVFSGAARLADAAEHVAALMRSAVAAGEPDRGFGGPRAFLAAEFDPVGVATVFFPERLVARSGGDYTAVANVMIGPDSDPAAEAGRILSAHARFASFDYAAAPEEDAPSARPVEAPAPEAGENDYAALVSAALEGVRRGDFTKVVPARMVEAPAPAGFSEAEALAWLRAAHPTAHTFSFGLGDGETWLGATPETLLRVSGGVLRTEALAGTGARVRHASADAAAEAALLADEKIAREQEAVSRDIAERLRELGLEPTLSGPPRVLRLAHTRHLLTVLSATLPSGADALRIAAALHPTPAVCGSPREAALDFLRRREGFSRGHFAGFSGWTDWRGDAHLQVNLRCARLKGNLVSLYAGAGVVAGSSPEAEARETTMKFRTAAEAIFGVR